MILQHEQPVIHVSPKKLTFVLMFHDAEKFGDTPVFKHEIVEEIHLSHLQGIHIINALHDVYKYLTTGYHFG